MLRFNELDHIKPAALIALSYAEFVFSPCYEGHWREKVTQLTYGLKAYPLACMCLPLKADAVLYGPIASFASPACNLGIYI